LPGKRNVLSTLSYVRIVINSIVYGTMPHSQVLSNNPYAKTNQPLTSY
jgi:hypothetical protein